MKIKELRIGNWIEVNTVNYLVYCIHSPMPLRDEKFSDKPFVELCNNGIVSCLLSDLKPIPLTEEWLKKFGFNKQPMSYDIKLSVKAMLKLAICNDKGKGEYYAIIIEDDDWVLLPNRIFYVHQLQNLYHVLSGEELTVKQQDS